ncbi:Uncharacterised protein [Mycobacteroides abscessus subsp. abscessus]|nr:Uncharacterised protein [Mycobacteroides abscessus subsp. abscessus]
MKKRIYASIAKRIWDINIVKCVILLMSMEVSLMETKLSKGS